MGPNGFTGGFYQTFKEEDLNSGCLKLFPKAEEEGNTPKLIYKASITLMPMPDKVTARKENFRPITLMTADVKILNKTLATLGLLKNPSKLNSTTHQKAHIPWSFNSFFSVIPSNVAIWLPSHHQKTIHLWSANVWQGSQKYSVLKLRSPTLQVNSLPAELPGKPQSESESHSVTSDSLWPVTIQSMEFSQPEYWSG